MTGIPMFAYVTVTSEANSFGLNNERWFDGKSVMALVTRDQSCLGRCNWWCVNELTIIKIDEILNLHQSCIDDSYYQCLARRFTTFSFNSTTVVVNGSRCQFQELCAPFSLPFDGAEKVPIHSAWVLTFTCYNVH